MSGSDPGWAAPGGEEPPRWGERVPGGYSPGGYNPDAVGSGGDGASAYGPPGGPAAPTLPGWTPPPRPGLVPLHPLGFGQLLGIAFAVIRWNPKATILPAVIVNLLQSAVLYGLGLAVALPGIDRIQHASAADQGPVVAGVVAEGSGVVLLSLALGVIGAGLLQGVVVVTVARGALAERPSLGAVLRAAGVRLLPLAGFSLLVGAAEFVVFGLLVAVVLLIAQAGVVGAVIAVLTALVGILGLAALVLWVTVKLCVAPSAIVLERRGVFGAIRRSWLLTRGAFWRTLGLILLVGIIVGAAAQAVGITVSVLGGAVTGILAPNLSSDDPMQAIVSGVIGGLPATFVTVIVAGIGQIASAGAVALVYLDQRMRTEGLDIELQRAVQQPGGPDPFAPR